MNDIINAIILGIVEGLTEFLPVSSTGHLILTSHLLGFEGESAKTFEIVIQFGAVLAVLVIYWKRFAGLFKDLFTFNFAHRNSVSIIHIALAMLPAVIAAFTVHSLIKQYLFGPETVLIGLVLGGILMIVAENTKRTITAENVDDISYKQAFYIGLFQLLALWPGFSRSGSTISGGLLVGTSQKAAAEFTFIVSVPVMFGASLYDLYKSREYLSVDDLPVFLVGLGAAFIVAMIAVVTFLNLIKKLRLTWFAIYRFALAAIFFIFVIL
ncbi:undecaprenyl-diphosphate phosphatase [Paenibacillus abyssi]|uniref:Undecaprenyl-diphosphatase n=1 Tax=Paenibacillus abyssi TaxID=1340531 RepID=A0A917D5P6_9BACL|nr:undecaprenyl-diphosphate phosphatase [Paenibacillus abyssi]GGG11660.1 undecaprenyl-diphosphatase [Paenibacillus abyssi]